jgi:hypothetical protein
LRYNKNTIFTLNNQLKNTGNYCSDILTAIEANDINNKEEGVTMPFDAEIKRAANELAWSPILTSTPRHT